MAEQQSVVLVKPDGVQRGLIGEIIARFERQLWFKESEINSYKRSLQQLCCYRPGGRAADDGEVVFR